jgi:molecular chaperone GrpE
MADNKKKQDNRKQTTIEGEVHTENELPLKEQQFENETLARESQEFLNEASTEELVEGIMALEKELDETRQKSGEYLDGWQRSRAEFANYRKRVERERQQIYQDTAGNIIRRYLEVVDDLERALKNKPDHGDGADWAKGIELIFRKMLALLEAEGVKPMEAQGNEFDPNLHEAVSQEDHPDYESCQIIEVVKTGYLIGDRVLRPAAVRVAR